MPEDNGRVTLENDVLRFFWDDGEGGWAVCLRDIVIIGEYTNADGPCAPDYFWVVVERGGTWHIAPMDAPGEQEVFSSIRSRLGCDWKYRLCGSTDPASNVLWPSVLADKRLFSFTPWPRRGWRKVLRFLWPVLKIDLTDEVKEYLRALPPS